MNYATEPGTFSIIDEELGLTLISAAAPSPHRLYYPNGQLRMEVHRFQDKLHGLSQFFSEAGVLLSTTWFYEGVVQGKATHYYPSGQLYTLQRFKHGVRVGLQESYYENGAPKSFIPYDAEGRLHGTVKLYAPDGTLKRSCSFNQGVPLE